MQIPSKAKTQRGRDRVEELLTQAIDIFIENGYAGTSIDEVIRRAGGSRSTVYQNYGSKEGLFLAALQHMADGIYEAYMKRYRHGLTLEEDLRTYADIMLTALTEPKALGAQRLIYAETTRIPKIGRWFFREGVQNCYESFARVLANHIDAPRESLIDTAARFTEMFRAPTTLRMLCDPSWAPSREDILREVNASVRLTIAAIGKLYAGHFIADPPQPAH
jgi:TetR/AcrR family transcriptional repressor NalC